MRNRWNWAEPRRRQGAEGTEGNPRGRRRVYIYTVPKAGTYLLAEIVTRLGYVNTGYHVGVDHCLDTKAKALEHAARRPSDTSLKQPYWRTFRSVPPGALCFGHVNPMIIPPQVAGGYSIVACRRSLRAVLTAEFVDFRFRREDVGWLSTANIPDHKDAFLEYLRRNGPVIAGGYIANREMRTAWYYTATRGGKHYVDISFESLWEKPLEAMRAIAEIVGNGGADDELMRIFDAAVKAENKTKSVKESFPVSRDELWTPDAKKLYAELQFPRFTRLLGYADADQDC